MFGLKLLLYEVLGRRIIRVLLERKAFRQAASLAFVTSTVRASHDACFRPTTGLIDTLRFGMSRALPAFRTRKLVLCESVHTSSSQAAHAVPSLYSGSASAEAFETHVSNGRNGVHQCGSPGGLLVQGARAQLSQPQAARVGRRSVAAAAKPTQVSCSSASHTGALASCCGVLGTSVPIWLPVRFSLAVPQAKLPT